ncbi:MAG TPA: ABC transporter permease, partial [Thermoleophilia bacterium]
MRRLWYITTKDLLETRRDRLAALFTIVLPVIFTVVLGLVIGNGGAQSLPLALVDADRGPAAQELVALLQKSPILDVQIYVAGTVDKAVQDQKVAAGLLIPAGFSTGMDAGKQVSVTVVRVQTSGG